ncbi:hypothetical protein Vadar_009773 [Vaccinium darrowii]|uniref:Uncharacterized protein n=1 Tax=Vaccinium darrowii TaxID=229202 RepID=A0ACB7YLS4_9ERIC|nr:hypothetical protein Vadar_009773 [Vaccinium darrowii]
MELSPPLPLLLAALLLLLSASLTQAQIDVQSLDLPSTISVDNGDFAIFNDDEHDANLISETNRRSLYWTAARHYYISYDALSANRIPCPMRFGRCWVIDVELKVQLPFLFPAFLHVYSTFRSPANPTRIIITIIF